MDVDEDQQPRDRFVKKRGGKGLRRSISQRDEGDNNSPSAAEVSPKRLRQAADVQQRLSPKKKREGLQLLADKQRAKLLRQIELPEQVRIPDCTGLRIDGIGDTLHVKFSFN